MAHPRSQRKVRNYLVLREFQLRYVAYMVGLSTALTGVLGYLVFLYNREAARVVDIRALDPTDAEARVLQAALHNSERNLVVGLVVFAVALAVILAVWQVVTTHRVAGPLYYIAHQTRRIRDGHLGSLRPLRKSDLLHGFFETFREMHAALRSRAESDASAFARLAEKAEAAGQTEIASELRELQRAREDLLR